MAIRAPDGANKCTEAKVSKDAMLHGREYPSSDMLKVVLFRITQVPHLPKNKMIDHFFYFMESNMQRKQSWKSWANPEETELGFGFDHRGWALSLSFSKYEKVPKFWHFPTSAFHETFTKLFLSKDMCRQLFSDPNLAMGISHQRTKIAKKTAIL